ncbi:co-chaperone GrpE [[Clostridium] scindens ATCC 35704]|nr:co-chaperone GrpE [[Clostridium] scindens ATCC 35704]
MEEPLENNQEKSQEEMVKEAVEEAKKSAGELPEGEPGEDQAEEENAKEASEDEEVSDNEEEEPDEEQEPDEEEEPDEEDEDKKSGKKLFGKKNKKDKKDEKIEELTDRLTRQMAEFDNFRKRTEKEKSQMYEIGAKDIIEKMLPVVDNFERGLDAVKEEDKEDPFIQGMEMVYKQLMTVLGELGVKPIEAVGKEFDPNLHNAVMHVEDENFGENIIAEEFQKGYMYRDSVVRHSMVKVAN